MEELLQITRLGIKAIGGSGSKNHVWLFSKIPMNTAFYRMSKFDSAQKLLQFQFRKCGSISHKFPDLVQNNFRPSNFGPKWLKLSPDDHNTYEDKVKEYL